MGYEVKGLGWPGREANYDCNSQVPRGIHNGRNIYYVFGRYPSGADDNEYPVIDLIICHGNFLNSDHDYIHKNIFRDLVVMGISRFAIAKCTLLQPLMVF